MSGLYICCICDDECGYYTINRIKKQHALPSVFTQTLGKETIFLFTEKGFAECIYFGTRRSLNSCRVPDGWHSTKFESLPSARRVALGKEPNFAECCQIGTRRSLNFCECHASGTRQSFRRPIPFASLSVPFQLFLPSAREKALGKAGFAGR